MKRPNTKKHWTALTLARYYDEHQTAARARDLWPVLKEIYDDPNNLNRALGGLRKDDFVDHVPVKSPSRDGGKTKTFAYYPTKTTIEQLRDIGEPTEMPDGSAIPDDINPSLTTSRATEGDDVALPPSDVMAPEYQTSYAGDGQRRTSYSKRDTTHISEDPVADLADDEADDEPVDDDDKHVCPYCGDTFDTPNGLGGHRTRAGRVGAHPSNPQRSSASSRLCFIGRAHRPSQFSRWHSDDPKLIGRYLAIRSGL